MSSAGFDRLDACDPRIVFADRFELLDDDVELFGERIQERQFDVEFPFPKFVGTALCEWFAEGVDTVAPSVPSSVAFIDRDSMIDEPGSDGVLEFIDTLIERLAVFDERTELPVLRRRHVDGFEFFHGDHASELKGIVFVGFSFDVGPSPGFLVGGADEGFQT